MTITQQDIADMLTGIIGATMGQVMTEYDDAGRDDSAEAVGDAIAEGATRAGKRIAEQMLEANKLVRTTYDHGHKFVGKLDDPNTCVHCGATRPAPVEEA